jgi:hypothetical protein
VQGLDRSTTPPRLYDRLRRSDSTEIRTNQDAVTPDQIHCSGPRVLVASGSVGTGKLRAAEAIAHAQRRQRPDALVTR